MRSFLIVEYTFHCVYVPQFLCPLICRWTSGSLPHPSFCQTGCREHCVVQLLSRVRLFATPWPTARRASLSFTVSQGLLKLMSIELVMPSNHLILCCPLLLLPSVLPSIRVFFSNVSALCLRWPKSWCFSISSSGEYSGLISFRMDWFDLLAVQGTLKTLGVHASLSIMIFSGYMSSRGPVGLYGGSIPSFLKTLHTFLSSGCHQFTVPPTVQEGSV